MSHSQVSLRGMFGHMGQGALRPEHRPPWGERIHRIGTEIISIRDVFEAHRVQDGERGNTTSVRQWVSTHCDPYSYETVMRAGSRSTLEVGWVPVVSEHTRFLAGFQGYSRETETDFPTTHETRDWNWDQIPDPPFTYMLHDRQTGLGDGVDKTPCIESEWEGGSMPLEWRPFWGEYVTIYGRHIIDRGHAHLNPEIHPAHTIIREHTTAASFGPGGAMVPVNRAILGMGFCGGFPSGGAGVAERWKLEFGGIPSGIWGDTEQCWATDLTKHPVTFRMYPPVPRPSDAARLQFRVVLCEFITCSDWKHVDAFLEVCQHDDPAKGGVHLAFRRWDRAAGLPAGFTPEVAPLALHPVATVRQDARGRDLYVDVRVDLAGKVIGIPVGYYTIVECGWNEPGPHDVRRYHVTFESVKAIDIDEGWDDWHLYYGVNGQWAAWYTDDFIEQGKTYGQDRKFIVWTVDDLPILIRDTGVEWDGTDAGNERLDRVQLTLPGPNHVDAVAGMPGVIILSRNGNTVRFSAQGTVAGDTEHSWIITLEQVG